LDLQQTTTMKNSCLVLEGGGLRGAFTSGVLEYFLERNLNFGRVIGVSAGACIGASFLSKQRGRNRKVNVEYPSDGRYMGIRHLLTTGSYFNMPFVFGELPRQLVPFDEQAFFLNPAEFDVLATSMETGSSVVFSKRELAETGIDKVLIASSSIPLLSRPENIEGQLYLDGGVADPLPVKYALQKHERAIVVLTRPWGYRKGKVGNSLLLKLVFRKYPRFLSTLLARNEAYNATLDFCAQMEQEGRLLLLAPSPEYSIGRTEKRLEKRLRLYHHGYQVAGELFEEIKLFLDSTVAHPLTDHLK
jgi:predicted patatin/cPLA2 family phospholipase